MDIDKTNKQIKALWGGGVVKKLMNQKKNQNQLWWLNRLMLKTPAQSGVTNKSKGGPDILA